MGKKKISTSHHQPSTINHQQLTINYPLIIFAGGNSSRMGRDKALLPFGGYPTLTQYQLARLQSGFETIYVSCKNKEKFNFDTHFIEDLKSYEEAAPHIGLISVFEQLDTDIICVLSVDAPYFGAEHFQKLLAHDSPATDAIIPKSPNGTQPLCAVYKRSVLTHLKALVSDKKYRFAHLFARTHVTYVDFLDESLFTNLNTPEEYHIAKLRG